MRRTASGLIVLMAALFLWSGRYLDVHPAWGYLHAFAEAAMVGGLADWFAVTALFRRPLGLPIPHTAIIPENKDRIADTMAGFLRDNFLTPAVVGRRMGSMNLAQAVGGYLADPRATQDSRIRAGAGELAVEVLESLDPERLGTQVRTGLKTQLAKLEVAPLLGGMLEAMIADGRHRPLIDKIIRWAGLVLEDNETLVRDMVHKRANAVLRFTGLDERLANSVLDGLYKLLAEVLVDPDHPLRSKIEEGLQDLAHGLREDPEMRERIERMKQELLENPAIGDWWQGVWERLRANLIESIGSSNGSTGHDYIGETLGELGAALRDDERLQRQVNRFARRTAVGVATRYGDQIVRLVSETVKRWDAQTITDRVESAVGRDLQFIRINGTLVGGLVGMTIHTLDIYVI
ncbi:DUF445 domain-containing protein [Qipengyuania flava]|uniref:DUF445 domain-containing protein n=1 Tax=Qipengyuania flava TaxID=192812 RepID=UPI001C56A248|nr:DUF445 domain-containing protein [Qipengyuania flava]MBW3166828.1 DUF445 domain-containing protein [Qipengyuania flava]MBY5964066.1 DUF445 domain-containing protein [Qipengyuania flava]MBY6010390.1 DUF445 domain-containing protein [Qipengyuania flava]MBY6024832.1 DUF445 domain-containing protein [Qipengyuania flava]